MEQKTKSLHPVGSLRDINTNAINMVYLEKGTAFVSCLIRVCMCASRSQLTGLFARLSMLDTSHVICILINRTKNLSGGFCIQPNKSGNFEFYKGTEFIAEFSLHNGKHSINTEPLMCASFKKSGSFQSILAQHGVTSENLHVYWSIPLAACSRVTYAEALQILENEKSFS